MTYIDKHIVETYSELLEGLSEDGKLELIENLSRSLKTKRSTKDKRFYDSFGAFASTQSPEAIAAEIKSSRKFRKKEIKF
jgi:hypothetical protein